MSKLTNPHALIDGKLVHIQDYNDELYKGINKFCPACKERLKYIKSSNKVAYFAHITKCEYEDMSWHKTWQSTLLYTEQTIISKINNIQRINRADGYNPESKLIIEFQHSPITRSYIQQREEVYDNMLWIFDNMIEINGLYGSDNENNKYAIIELDTKLVNRYQYIYCTKKVYFDVGIGLFEPFDIHNIWFGKFLTYRDFYIKYLNNSYKFIMQPEDYKCNDFNVKILMKKDLQYYRIFYDKRSNLLNNKSIYYDGDGYTYPIGNIIDYIDNIRADINGNILSLYKVYEIKDILKRVGFMWCKENKTWQIKLNKHNNLVEWLIRYIIPDKYKDYLKYTKCTIKYSDNEVINYLKKLGSASLLCEIYKRNRNIKDIKVTNVDNVTGYFADESMMWTKFENYRFILPFDFISFHYSEDRYLLLDKFENAIIKECYDREFKISHIQSHEYIKLDDNDVFIIINSNTNGTRYIKLDDHYLKDDIRDDWIKRPYFFSYNTNLKRNSMIDFYLLMFIMDYTIYSIICEYL